MKENDLVRLMDVYIGCPLQSCTRFAKAEKKELTWAEVDEITCWLTGYSKENLSELIGSNITYGDFFLQALELNPNRKLIKGVVCGIRVEDIAEPLMQEIRYLTKHQHASRIVFIYKKD